MWYFIIFFILFIVFIYKNKKTIKKSKIKKIAPFGYHLFYTDENTKHKKQNVIYKKLLFSQKYNIQGKPDFIYKKFNTCYVVELKSGTIKKEQMPHLGDLMQLVAYFLIIEDVYGYKVKKGKLIYNDYCFVVKNTKSLRQHFLKILNDMRIMLKTGNGTPNCSFVHCKHCMCRQTVCQFYDNI